MIRNFSSVTQSEDTTNGDLRVSIFSCAICKHSGRDKNAVIASLELSCQIFKIMNVSIFVKEIINNLIKQ